MLIFNTEIKTKVNIIDAPMGSGKTTAMLNYINDDESDMLYMYVTPLISEQERVKEYCSWKDIKMPEERHQGDTKLKSLKDLLRRKKNVVTTHAMLKRLDDEAIQLCKDNGYTLVLDEVADVINEYPITSHDLKTILDNYAYEAADHTLMWRKECDDYTGKFEEEKQLCNHYSLAHFREKYMLSLFPIDYFNAFEKVFIMTYMFDAQVQKYYYDFFHINYNYLYVTKDEYNNYVLTTTPTTINVKYDYKNLIHIWDNKTANQLCKGKYDLSHAWFKKNIDCEEITTLRKHITNFVKNVCKAKGQDVLWTTFLDGKKALAAKGYTKSFLHHTARATNDYRDRTCVIYAVNKFMYPTIKNFFTDNNIKVNEDKYALSEMLQFIWRSAIRDGHEINVYIPSKRMRDLLIEWINENSI